MALILPEQVRGEVTTPGGVSSRVLAVAMTAHEAQLLRAYQVFIEHHHLNVARVCQLCAGDVEIAVRTDFIAASCACRLRTYPVATAGTDLVLSDLPAASGIVAPDGDVVPRLGTFSPSEAALLREYKRRVLVAFHWREKAFCDDCFRANRKEGCSFHVLDDRIGLRCRCRQHSVVGGRY